ncbi:cytochrome-b5 reductase [Fusarium longipes]|uniref:NADH-cytochrome b5 reductase n=1 Tax=Fusarium longipes TaxID=694270 RepID=A0A395SJP5_9HYPO|nr:cytochrome-b5 reductase [Fusarium longipes]
MALRLSLSRPAPLIATLTASAIGVGILSKMMFSTASAESNAPQKIFNGAFPSVKLPLHSSEYESPDTKRLRFKLPQETAITGIPLGSALLTFTWPEGSFLPTPRPYTPISPSDEPGYMDLLVKKYPNGKGSGYLHSLQPGDKLYFAAVLPEYRWKTNSFPHITLIAGGCGITPLFQLAQGILRDPQDKTCLTLIFGARSDEDVLLKKELDGFAREFPGRFEVKYTVSDPVQGSSLRKGRVDKALLEEVLGSKGVVKENTKVFVCGPKAMEEALVGRRGQGILGELGFTKNQIHKF